MVAVVVEGGGAAEGGEAGSDGGDVVAHWPAGRVEGGVVAAFDVGADLGAETEPEPAVGGIRELPGDLGGDHGAAGEGHGDAGEQVDVGGEGGDRARQVGGAARFGDDEHGVAAVGGVAGELLGGVQRHAAGHEVELHAQFLMRR